MFKRIVGVAFMPFVFTCIAVGAVVGLGSSSVIGSPGCCDVNLRSAVIDNLPAVHLERREILISLLEKSPPLGQALANLDLDDGAVLQDDQLLSRQLLNDDEEALDEIKEL